MHRSGTSCVAGAFVAAGWTVPGGAIRNWDNPRGHHESLELIRLHEEILAASGGHWLSPPSHVAWTAEHRARRDALVREGVVLKDPRALLVRSFWTDAPVRTIGVVRHPVAVARSLWAWRGMPLVEGLDLWFAHNQALVDAGVPTLVFGGPVEGIRTRLLDLVGDCGGRLDATVAVDPSEIHHEGGPVSDEVPADLIQRCEALWQDLGGGPVVSGSFPWEALERLRAGDEGGLDELLALGPAGIAPVGMALLKAGRAQRLDEVLVGDGPSHRLWKAKALLELRRPAEAVPLLIGHGDHEARLLLGRALHQAGRREEADAHLAALARESLYPHTCHAQRAAWAEEMGDLARSVDLLAEAIAVAPHRRRGRLRDRLARLLDRVGRGDDAEHQRAAIAQEDPQWHARRGG